MGLSNHRYLSKGGNSVFKPSRIGKYAEINLYEANPPYLIKGLVLKGMAIDQT